MFAARKEAEKKDPALVIPGLLSFFFHVIAGGQGKGGFEARNVKTEEKKTHAAASTNT